MFWYGVAFFTKLVLVWVSLSETKYRHDTGPQTTALAENPPILIRTGRGIRFWPPRSPGRPKNGQNRPGNFPKVLNFFWYGTACFLLMKRCSLRDLGLRWWVKSGGPPNTPRAGVLPLGSARAPAGPCAFARFWPRGAQIPVVLPVVPCPDPCGSL